MGYRFNPFTSNFDEVNSKHSKLDELLWSEAGHTIDTDFELNSNKVIYDSVRESYLGGGSNRGIYFRDPLDINSTFGFGVTSALQPYIRGSENGNERLYSKSHFSPFTDNTYDLGYAGGGGFYWKDLLIKGGITAPSYVDFDLTATPTHQEGRLHWDDDSKTLELGMAGGEVKLQIGQEILIRAKNDQGAQIDNGEAVYISGGDGANPLVKLADANEDTSHGTIAIATEDVASAQFGYFTTTGLVRELNTNAWTAGTQLYLSQTAGTLTSTQPTAPANKVEVATVIRQSATVGVIYAKIHAHPTLDGASNVNIVGVADNDVITYRSASNTWENTNTLELDRLTIRGDNVVNRISYPLSGLSAFQQTINVVVDGAAIYMETNDVDGVGGDAGGNLAYVFDEEQHILDCTTGAGTDGKAQVALAVGTATAPKINYVYVVPDGAGVATLSSSESLPTGTFAWHSIVVLQDTATVTSHGPISLQRTTEAVKHNGRGQLSYMREKLRWLGPKYVSGCTSTLDDGAAMNLSVSAGVVFQLHRQNFPALNVVTHGATVANANGGGALNILENVHDLNDIAETADGSPIGVNKYFSLTIWATMASSDQNGNQSKLFVNLPTGTYNSESAVVADASNFDVRTADQEFNNTAFLVSRVTFKKTSGDHTPVGAEVYSLTGSPMGTIGGGAGSTALTEFSDANWKVYDDGDPTRIIDLQAGSIAAGNTRTITMADNDVDLGGVASRTVGIGVNQVIIADAADIVDNDYAKFTADGLEGKNYSEVKTDLSLENVTNVATDDTAYNEGTWDANTDAATKNAIRDKIETMDTAIGLNTTHTTDNTTKIFAITVLDPTATQALTNEVFIAWTHAAITITKIQVEIDTTDNIAANLKWADDFQALTNAATIDVITTVSGGKLTITSGFDDATVASGKAIYMDFNSAAPSATPKQYHLQISYTID